ncbi:hypothetical protein LguiB_023975 [Lonicera macranthoides]
MDEKNGETKDSSIFHLRLPPIPPPSITTARAPVISVKGLIGGPVTTTDISRPYRNSGTILHICFYTKFANAHPRVGAREKNERKRKKGRKESAERLAKEDGKKNGSSSVIRESVFSLSVRILSFHPIKSLKSLALHPSGGVVILGEGEEKKKTTYIEKGEETTWLGRRRDTIANDYSCSLVSRYLSLFIDNLVSAGGKYCVGYVAKSQQHRIAANQWYRGLACTWKKFLNTCASREVIENIPLHSLPEP